MFLYLLGTNFSNLEFTRFVSQLFFLLCWALFAAATGYFINNWSDLEEDRKAGKKNYLEKINPVYYGPVIMLLVILSALALAPLAFMYPFLWALFGIQLLLFIAYSFNPLRLKKRIGAAPVTDALYAHLLPGLLAYCTAARPAGITLSVVLLSIWLFCYGFRNILLHFVRDYVPDSKSGHLTLAHTMGNAALIRISNLLIPIEIFLLSAVCVVINFWLTGIILISVAWRFYLVTQVWKTENWCGDHRLSYWTLNDVYEKISVPVAWVVLVKPFWLGIAGLLVMVALFKANMHALYEDGLQTIRNYK